MVQRIAACKTRLQEVVRHQLQIIQKVDNPVLVTPKIAKVSWQASGTKIKTAIRGSLIDIAKNHAVVYGPRDSGKTILFQTLAADLSELRTTTKGARLALYAEIKSSDAIESKQGIADFLDAATSKEFPGEVLKHAIVLIDGLGEKHLFAFDCLMELATERDCR